MLFLCGPARESRVGGPNPPTSVPENRQTFRLRTPLSGVEVDDVYNKNIQIADLNALVAALAVLRWKKIMGFYHDFEGELSSSDVVETNAMISDRDEQG